MAKPNPSPNGTPENSPAIHRWVNGVNGVKSRQGRKKSMESHPAFFRPCGAWLLFHSKPTVETVGYSRASLRDWGGVNVAFPDRGSPSRSASETPTAWDFYARRRNRK